MSSKISGDQQPTPDYQKRPASQYGRGGYIPTGGSDTGYPIKTTATRSITKHTLAKNVKTKEDYKNFMLEMRESYSEIASNSLKLQEKRENEREYTSKLYSPFRKIITSIINLSSIASSGVARSENTTYLAEEAEKKSVFIRILAAIAIPLMLPIIAVVAILTAPVAAVHLPIQKLQRLIQDKQHAKNLFNYLYSDILQQTFSIISVKDINGKFWQKLAKACDKSIKNAKKPTISSKKEEHDQDQETYIKYIEKTLTSDFKKLIEKLPDKGDTSIKDDFKKHVFSFKDYLDFSIRIIVSNCVRDNFNKYIDKASLNKKNIYL